MEDADTRQQKKEGLLHGLSKAELALLAAAPCPVLATAQRIQRAIITRQSAGGIAAPPPIVSRVFQEISNGLLAYNNATKMKEVPVPFEYVQLNAYLLNCSALLCPVAISAFTNSLALALFATFVIVGAFYSIFIVANDMEDPFGNQINDMPMLAYHEEFCASVYAMLTHAWLPEDQWLVKQGKWVDPAKLEQKTSAFWGSIGQSDRANNTRARAAVAPFASLLNNQKLANLRKPTPNLRKPSRLERTVHKVLVTVTPADNVKLPHVLTFPSDSTKEEASQRELAPQGDASAIGAALRRASEAASVAAMARPIVD